MTEGDRVTARPGRAQRWLAIGVVTGLLIATAAAFAVTERLKLTPSPILDTQVTQIFSPICGCPTATATVSFRLRRGGRVEVDVIGSHGALVRRLARHHFPAGFVFFRWFGRNSAGLISPDGDYQIRVVLSSEHRTIVFPNQIRLDTKAPTIESFHPLRRAASVGERTRITYRLNEVAHPILLVDGRPAVVGRFAHQDGSIDWFGKVDGEPVRQGTHQLALEARDSAGNLSAPTASLTIRIRAPKGRQHKHRSAR